MFKFIFCVTVKRALTDTILEVILFSTTEEVATQKLKNLLDNSSDFEFRLTHVEEQGNYL